MAATRHGLTHVESSEYEYLHESGWRQVWRHPSGALAMRHPTAGYWVTSFDGGLTIRDEGFSSSLRAAARKIDRHLTSADT